MTKIKWIFLSLTLAYTSFASAAVYLTTFRISFDIETEERRTTGIWGKLAGHYSRSDEIQIIRESRDALDRSFPPRENWKVLPAVIEYTSMDSSKPKRKASEGFFGREKVDKYQSFSADGSVVFRVLSDVPLQMPLVTSQRIDSAKLIVRKLGTRIAEVKIDDPQELFGQVQFADEALAAQTLTLTPQLRYAFYKKLVGQDVEKRSDEFELELMLQGDEEMPKIVLKEWQLSKIPDFKALFYRSPTRFVTPSFYKALCANVLGTAEK